MTHIRNQIGLLIQQVITQWRIKHEKLVLMPQGTQWWKFKPFTSLNANNGMDLIWMKTMMVHRLSTKILKNHFNKELVADIPKWGVRVIRWWINWVPFRNHKFGKSFVISFLTSTRRVGAWVSLSYVVMIQMCIAIAADQLNTNSKKADVNFHIEGITYANCYISQCIQFTSQVDSIAVGRIWLLMPIMSMIVLGFMT